jgi:hypothetical protein
MVVKRFYILSLLLLALSVSHTATAQSLVPLRTVARLPAVLMESSGLYAPSPDSIWSHGDSGNPPNLYLMDSACNVRRTVNVRGVPNIDWEELAADQQGNLYIGEFGNNGNNHQNLKIYKIPNFRALRNVDTVDAQVIAFSYEDQTAFPPPLTNYIYDCEAMIAFEDSIYLCTKDYYARPYLGFTRVYVIPNVAGTHVAKLVKQVATDASDKELGGITGMAISPDRRRVVLTAHQKLYIAQNFTGRAFWNVAWQSAQYNPLLPAREAITFRDSCNVYISDDLGSITTGYLYTVNVCAWVRTPSAELSQNDSKMRCFPNPLYSQSDLRVDFQEALNKNTVLEVIDELGRKVGFVSLAQGTQTVTVAARYFPTNGIYYLRLADETAYIRVMKMD